MRVSFRIRNRIGRITGSLEMHLSFSDSASDASDAQAK